MRQLLQPDELRCAPAHADSWCRNCRAWADHPQQIPGGKSVFTLNSRSESCTYRPISLQPTAAKKAAHV
jgi:hypothetical protein